MSPERMGSSGEDEPRDEEMDSEDPEQEPDYGSYSLADLYSVEKYIDGDRYPERLAKARAEIEQRQADDYEDPGLAEPALDPVLDRRGNRIFWGVLILLVLIGIGALVFGGSRGGPAPEAVSEAQRERVEAVKEAIADSVEAEDVQVRLERNASRRILHVRLRSADLGERSEAEVAADAAKIAYGAYQALRRPHRVEILFVTVRPKLGFLEEEVIGEPHQFSAEELEARAETP